MHQHHLRGPEISPLKWPLAQANRNPQIMFYVNIHYPGPSQSILHLSYDGAVLCYVAILSRVEYQLVLRGQQLTEKKIG